MSHLPEQVEPPAGHITLRYWAAARAALGVAEELVEVRGEVALSELIDGVIARHGGPAGRAAQVLGACSFLHGDRPVGTADRAGILVGAGDTVEFLPPFAGG